MYCIYIVYKTFYVIFIHFYFKDITICARQFDQNLGSSLIDFFHVHTSIWTKYMILFHLFFLLHTTIRPRLRVHTDFFFIICTRPFDQIIWSSFIYSFFSARPFDQKLGSSLIYFSHLHTTIRQKYMTFFFSFCTSNRLKIRVIINLLFIFVHNHSTKSGSLLLFNLFFS